MDSPTDIFMKMVEQFKKNKDKGQMIQIMIDYCSSTSPENIYELKKMLELEFSKEVECTYCYTSTPIDYGCDLREIFYDRDNKLIHDGQKLLDLFKRKKLRDMWHIMTDIDDTLYPNTEHGTFIAGSDKSWKQKTAYPGIKKLYQFFHENPSCSTYSTILSATPGCLKSSKLKDSHNLLHDIFDGDYGFIQGPESKGEILKHIPEIFANCVGHLCNINKKTSIYSISELFTLFGNTKFERFKQYLTLFPEYKILFIGDNGQGDVLAGTRMIEYSPSCHVFIHKVSEDGINFRESQEESTERLHFFTNYGELAEKFAEMGIFTIENVEKIKKSIIEVVESTEFKGLYTGGRKRIRCTKKDVQKKGVQKIIKEKRIKEKVIKKENYRVNCYVKMI